MAPIKMDFANANPPAINGGKSKSSIEDQVNEQYDSEASMAFYEHVMGGGGDDIHYGIFLSERDGLKESSQHSIDALVQMAEDCGALKAVRFCVAAVKRLALAMLCGCLVIKAPTSMTRHASKHTQHKTNPICQLVILNLSLFFRGGKFPVARPRRAAVCT
jgi:hypothetical protein